jgi:hypothetical protein
LFEDAPVIYISGLLSLITGFSLAVFHNTWTADWRLVITVFGWLMLGKGVMLIALPGIMKKICKNLFKTDSALMADGFICLVFGLVFAYLGFLT